MLCEGDCLRAESCNSLMRGKETYKRYISLGDGPIPVNFKVNTSDWKNNKGNKTFLINERK